MQVHHTDKINEKTINLSELFVNSFFSTVYFVSIGSKGREYMPYLFHLLSQRSIKNVDLYALK